MFYVAEGAVEAKIHRTRYIVGPGGMFIVPRGALVNLRVLKRTKPLFGIVKRKQIRDHKYFRTDS